MGALDKGFCVLIPVLNEAAGLERCVEETIPVLRSCEPKGAMLIVDDGSTDSTPAIIERLKTRFAELHVERHEKNRGYGAALVTAARAAQALGFGYGLFMDSDLTNHPRYIPDFLEKMREDLDVIKATRYSPGGGMEGVPLHRALISRIGNRVARMLFGVPITDVTNGFRAVKLSLLSRMDLREKGFAIIMEELCQAKRLGATFGEVPYVLTSRDPNQGVSRFVYRPKVFMKYLGYALESAFPAPARNSRGPSTERT